ncbi:acyltransferase family protein [Pseudomonas quasicaspiana]|uniref:acyltransferase family protein n=1 Tax=Pseudomonas quasicaspiana TaxID=2829821 RepID=UPI001E6011D0|nr:acyltransferase [Pseudomonas quasicaspiana]MCD5972329.1 acyltransferase [Pseudomonas quasicaspiana]
MDKIYAVQAFRGLAALMVVAFHGLSIQEKYLPGSMLLPQIFNLGQTGVDLFFVISGFVMVVVSQSKVYSTRGVAAFLRNRMLRIYPTYWVYYFLLLVVFLSVPGIINSSQGGEVDLIKSFFLVPNDKLPLLLVAWTLTHELWFYLVFAGLLLLRNRMRLVGLGVWLAVIILASGWQFTSPLLRVAFHIFTVEFILGALLAYAYLSLRSEKLGGIIAILGLAVASILLYFGFSEVAKGNVDVQSKISISRAVFLGGGFSMLVFSMAILESLKWVSVTNALRFLGDISYSVYLSHVLILSLLGRVWYALNASGTVAGFHAAVFWVAAFASVVIGGYLAFALIERPLLKATLYRLNSKASTDTKQEIRRSY